MRHVRQAGLLALFCGLAGCAVAGDTSALESRLRVYEERVATLNHELETLQNDLSLARQKARHYQKAATKSGKVVLTSEQTTALFQAQSLAINSLLTGGLDEDDTAGHDVLNTIVVPLDGQGAPVKLPGRMTIELLEPARAGENKRIGRWEFSPQQTREHWYSGFLASGFKFRLHWQKPPQHGTLVLHAHLETADGRTFDATETVTIFPEAMSPEKAESQPSQQNDPPEQLLDADAHEKSSP